VIACFFKCNLCRYTPVTLPRVEETLGADADSGVDEVFVVGLLQVVGSN
jgi:hypothetical protein